VRSSASIRDCVGWLVGPSVCRFVRPSVRSSVGPTSTMQLRGKLVTSRLLQEEEKEEETEYVAIPLCRDSFVPRD
jgi:hypothetical protein